MSKEAMKLALRSIRELVIDESDDAPALQGVRMRKQAAEKALREALANEALDRMAENARELGLDYGVEQDLRVFARIDAMRAKGLLKLTAALEQPAQQQEPVAWLEILRNNKTSSDEVIGAFLRGHAEHLTGEAFVITSPPAQRKPLTVEKILHLVDAYVGAPSMSYPLDSSDWINFSRAIEAARGIKE